MVLVKNIHKNLLDYLDAVVLCQDVRVGIFMYLWNNIIKNAFYFDIEKGVSFPFLFIHLYVGELYFTATFQKEEIIQNMRYKGA